MRYAGFVFCSLIGYVIGNYLLTGAAAAYASVLISYHLYLALLLVLSKQQKGLTMPIGQTIVTHTAILGLLIAIPFLRDQIPFFSIIRLFIPALAPFEVKWLFSSEKKMATPDGEEKAIPAPSKKNKKNEEPINIDDLINRATAEEHEEFLAYLRQAHRAFMKPGRSVREEYGNWLADRARKKAAQAAMIAAASGASNTSTTPR